MATERKRGVLVTYEAGGCPRAYAMGPVGRRDEVREEARIHLDAYRMERAVVGDPLATAKYVRREQVLEL